MFVVGGSGKFLTILKKGEDMRKRLSVIIVLSILAVSAGCVQMRDYTGERDGHFGLDVSRGFGKGIEPRKDYYVISGGEGIVVGDTKSEITKKIGLPDSVTSTFEGYECWRYHQRSVEFIFSGEELREWKQL
jgi:hypothetical protein